MWQGSLVDLAFSEWIIEAYRNKVAPDYAKIAENAVAMAKRQFAFSQEQKYHQKGLSKSKVGNGFQILDVHECGVPYEEKDILDIFSKVQQIITQIPEYDSPEAGKSLHQYLSTASYLMPNQTFWSLEYEGVTLKPQIDLVRHAGKAIHVIDWKVSDSHSSDYSKQLIMAGMVAFHNIKKKNLEKGWTPPTLQDVSLYEINLMNGNIKQHPFTRESTAATLDYVYKFRDEFSQLTSNRKWNELNIEDFETTDKRETCLFCKFKPLCIHLIQNNFRYDEQKYSQLVQAGQLA